MNTELIPYLTFENTKQALEYYQEVFGVTDVYRESPTEQQAEEMSFNEDVDVNNLTLLANFKVLGKEVWCADSFMGKPVVSSLISLMFKVNLKDSEALTEMNSLYERLVTSEEVKVIIPFEKKSSGNRYGQIVDRYGITWIFNAVK